MNLHAVVAPCIAPVNPPILCTLRMSTGYTIGPDGTQYPTYRDYVNVPVDVQALSYTDLMKIGGLNIQGTRRKAYINGNWEGLNRPRQKGGDLLVMPNLPDFPGPTTWLIAMVSEWWQTWCCVLVTLQNGG